MNRKYTLIKYVLIASLSAAFNTGCSISPKLLPDAEFNALMVDADAAIHDANWDKAINKLEQAARIHPNNLGVRLKQGQAYQHSGKLALAHNTYQQIIDSDPAPSGKNAEIIRTARVNQAKLGFRSAEPVQPEGVISQTVADAASPVEKITEPAGTVEVDRVPDLNMTAEPATAGDSNGESNPPASDAGLVAPANEQTEIGIQLQRWVDAWQNKRIQEYFSCYAETYAGGLGSPEAWRSQRKSRISQSRNIAIALSEINITRLENDRVEVSFIQQYQSSGHKDAGLKTLQLQKVNGLWLIEGEQFVKQ